MNALHRIHAALEPGGLMIDTQPVSARPPVEVDGVAVGTLDMRAWRATIDAIDGLTGEVVEEGRYALDVERSIVVTDAYDSAAEFLELVKDWKGTCVPPRLEQRLSGIASSVELHQDVRLRLFRSLPSGEYAARSPT